MCLSMSARRSALGRLTISSSSFGYTYTAKMSPQPAFAPNGGLIGVHEVKVMVVLAR